MKRAAVVVAVAAAVLCGVAAADPVSNQPTPVSTSGQTTGSTNESGGAGVSQGSKPQTTCPVSGKPVDKATFLDFQGQRIYFCGAGCKAEFRKDPEKYFAKIAAEKVQLENIQTTCPVSGDVLGAGDMKPVTIVHKGRTVRLCCQGCVSKFEKEPAKYLAKLPGEQPPQLKPHGAPAANS